WSMAGVEGDIPSATYTQSGATINAGANTATIQNALNACSGGRFVKLGPGNFSIGGLQIRNSGCVLRGSGADQTLITVTSPSPTGCSTSFNNAIAMCTGGNTQFSANWTGGFAQGTTQITLASVGSLTVGQPIFLTQRDDTTDSGDIDVCEAGGTSCSAQGGGSSNFSPTGGGFSAISAYKVTAINGTTVTLDHGIILPNYRAAQSPIAIWYSNGVFLQKSGVEDLSFDFSALNGANGILCVYCYNTWETG